MNIDYSKDFSCGKYKHYKGNYYTVYGLAIDTEDNPYIIYRAEYDDKKFWIRPYKMFFEKIKDNENYIERFHKTNKNNINRKEAINELVSKEKIFNFELNRRVPNGMHGGVRGGTNPSYSIDVYSFFRNAP